MGIFGVQETILNDEDNVVVFQVVETEIPEVNERFTSDSQHQGLTKRESESSRRWWKRRRQEVMPPLECLVNTRGRARDSDGSDSGLQQPSVVDVKPCESEFASQSAWTVDTDGTLRSLSSRETGAPPCLYRGVHDATGAVTAETVLASCIDQKLQSKLSSTSVDVPVQPRRPVNMIMVRYRAVHAKNGDVNTPPTPSPASPTMTSTLAMPTSRASADGDEHPSVSLKFFPVSRQHSPVIPTQNRRLDPSTNNGRQRYGGPLNILRDTNPILLLGNSQHDYSTFHDKSRKRNERDGKASLTRRITDRESSVSYKTRPIQIHPYIAASKNDVWTDPQTGLEYQTDLCGYLGHDRKEKGRHTLMGVGQYKKFVVKVYGIAYYVSKRDVLSSNHVFEPFAALSTAELRKRPDFYEHLRHMQSPESPDRGSFERTLMIKTNMQLAAETIRNSLHADWKMLTEEAKHLLINSSIQPRPANQETLALIQSPNNPSRCSCSQVAPPEYQADADCCARGTELAFTWRKNGDLEVRLNRRLMETFQRPDIAQAIFYEYFRQDDPMSPDFVDHAIEGFPFLLAPLSQVKGFSMPQGSTKSPDTANAVIKTIGGIFEAISSQSHALVGMAQQGASEATGHALHAAKTFSDAAQNMAKEVDRRKDAMIKFTVALPETLKALPYLMKTAPTTFVRLFTQDKDAIQTVSDWVGVKIMTPPEEAEPQRKVSQGRAFGYPLSRWFGEVYYAPDEIGPMVIHPATNMTRKVFLALVHLYLLLLFIVSFPGSYATRTKLVVRKHCIVRDLSDSDSDATEDDTEDEENINDTSGGGLASEERRRLRRESECPSKNSIDFSRARGILRPSLSVDSPVREEQASPLKKKSLSYFL
jgi:hypothetical protein